MELARMHVEERLSYRVIAKRVWERLGKKMSPKLACQMVNEIARLTKSSVEIKREYHPRWSGYLTIDDKWVRVRGKRVLSLVAVDKSGDVVHSELHGEQTQEVYDHFLVYLRDRLEYPFRAVTTDFDQQLGQAIERELSPVILHQKCLWHALEIIKGLIHYPQTRRRYTRLTKEIDRWKETLADRKQSLYDTQRRIRMLEQELMVLRQAYRQKEELLERLKDMLFAADRNTSQEQWRIFCRLYRTHSPAVLRFVATHWGALLQHQNDPKIPKTTVRAENINRQFERRFKTIESFQGIETAFHYQNLYRSYLRFKPFTDCRHSRRKANGLSPLQLCGATIQSSDWIKHVIRYP